MKKKKRKTTQSRSWTFRLGNGRKVQITKPIAYEFHIPEIDKTLTVYGSPYAINELTRWMKMNERIWGLFKEFESQLTSISVDRMLMYYEQRKAKKTKTRKHR